MTEKKQQNLDLEALRHSTSHVLADAIQRLFPGTKLAIGPAIKDGFYYDFDSQTTFSEEDLKKIEKQMKRIIGANLKFETQTISKKEAIDLFAQKNEDYKIELINDLEDEEISIYKHGEFIDLCKGPHIQSTGQIKAFKLLSTAGAYWRGNEKGPMLQRIYGTAFFSKEEIDEYLKMQEELKKRDHRKLGKDLELFSFNDIVGPGLVLYHPKGALIRTLIEDYIKKEHLRRGYDLVIGPHILKSDTWKISGHYDYYKEHMYFFDIEGSEFGIKPMNCPGHMIVYKAKKRSYRDLPIKLFELGTVYRHEKSGVLHGLLRVRGFTQDDAHVFCLPDQLQNEIIKVIEFVQETLQVFGFDKFSVEVSTQPEKYIGKDEDWARAQEALEESLKTKGIAYVINEGDGAFYGPKIDIKLTDVFQREWQCATIQCDFALPERFDLTYTDDQGKEQRPIMLHRVILGSIERFFGALIEHHGGNFPVWLAPVQTKIIPIADKHHAFCQDLQDQFLANDIRSEVDLRSEKMQKKIRKAEKEKIPYMIVVGDKEVENQSLSIRSKIKGDMGTMAIADFIDTIKSEQSKKK